MSYEENKISDKIDGGLINQKEIIDDLLGKLKLLPEPYKTKAFDNISINRIDIKGYDISNKSLSNAVLFAFDWGDTKEGAYFWNEYHDTLTELTNPD